MAEGDAGGKTAGTRTLCVHRDTLGGPLREKSGGMENVKWKREDGKWREPGTVSKRWAVGFPLYTINYRLSTDVKLRAKTPSAGAWP